MGGRVSRKCCLQPFCEEVGIVGVELEEASIGSAEVAFGAIDIAPTVAEEIVTEVAVAFEQGFVVVVGVALEEKFAVGALALAAKLGVAVEVARLVELKERAPCP